jgi:hypothetical protein
VCSGKSNTLPPQPLELAKRKKKRKKKRKRKKKKKKKKKKRKKGRKGMKPWSLVSSNPVKDFEDDRSIMCAQLCLSAASC